MKIYSIATILTMLIAVRFGYLGLSAFHFKKLENDAGEMAGLTIMACTLAILCGL